MTKSKWHVYVLRKNSRIGYAEVYTDYYTNYKCTEDELKDYIPTIKGVFAKECVCLPDDIIIEYDSVDGTEEEVEIIDIHMFTSYGRRHFISVFENSFKLNDNGYFEFTLLNGRKQYVKSDKVFEYCVVKHLTDGTETNDENNKSSDQNNG